MKGVYLWVDDEDEIIYIGEGENLYKRFNNGY
ncbi:MAG: GIY-YIG nuclease family protein [Clostridiales bacterium]|nr:GIY-YIG nuclease family protein [Clostridiales bacterium]